MKKIPSWKIKKKKIKKKSQSTRFRAAACRPRLDGRKEKHFSRRWVRNTWTDWTCCACVCWVWKHWWEATPRQETKTWSGLWAWVPIKISPWWTWCTSRLCRQVLFDSVGRVMSCKCMVWRHKPSHRNHIAPFLHGPLVLLDVTPLGWLLPKPMLQWPIDINRGHQITKIYKPVLSTGV